MIIIENLSNKTNTQVCEFVLGILGFFAQRGGTIWFHKEREGREIIVNTDDDPVRPGMLSYDEYDEGGVTLGPDGAFLNAWEDIHDEINL